MATDNENKKIQSLEIPRVSAAFNEGDGTLQNKGQREQNTGQHEQREMNQPE